MLEQGTLIGDYRIVGVLARGGMGVIYEAVQTGIDRPVALKLLSPMLADDPEFTARFRAEGAVQASLDHPHVLPVYGAGESEHGLYLAMRLVRGPNLRELIRERRLPASAALELLGQVAEALDAAHAAGLVHRDIKPSNVLVEGGNHAYLADFGLTRSHAGTTTVGGVRGTLAYMAPEVITGSAATEASDRYAFAAMAYECLTGAPPFDRATEAAVLFAAVNDAPPSASATREELPATLDAVFAEALAKAPDRRPASAVQLLTRIRDVLTEGDRLALPSPSPAPTPAQSADTAGRIVGAPEPPPRRRRHAGLVAAGAVLGALLAGGIALAIGDGGSSSAATAAVPPPDTGALLLGSTLPGAGVRTVACDGRAVTATAPSCTLAQLTRSDGPLVASADGVIRSWYVRGAIGELQLAILRQRDGLTYQVATSQYAHAYDTGPHRFPANVPVQRGDRLGVVVSPGSGIGIHPAEGDTIARWTPRLRGAPHRAPDRGAPAGAGELLVRADLLPGGTVDEPAQIQGDAAASLPPGHVIRRLTMKFTEQGQVKVAIVELGRRVAVDLFRGGRRVARMDLDGMLAGGTVTDSFTYNYDDLPAAGEVDVSYVNVDSSTVITHSYGITPTGFEYYS